MTRIESFAAHALAGLLASPRREMGDAVETAWRYADKMEAAAEARASTMRDNPGRFRLVAHTAFLAPMLNGLAPGINLANRERRVIGECIDRYGVAISASDEFDGRCELTHLFCTCRAYVFSRPRD